ncbi:hypothetical protein GGU11DRAFT_747635 [Lentinula aff. detonsa]|nr:hypothetical protein GGU11DRAFT_747635 [Lentinula aff. detonsa]
MNGPAAMPMMQHQPQIQQNLPSSSTCNRQPIHLKSDDDYCYNGKRAHTEMQAVVAQYKRELQGFSPASHPAGVSRHSPNKPRNAPYPSTSPQKAGSVKEESVTTMPSSTPAGPTIIPQYLTLLFSSVVELTSAMLRLCFRASV